jgi:hypothetical protein
MEEDSVVALPRPGTGVTDDPLQAVLREGARRMLMQAIEAEVETFLAAHAGLVDEQGRRRVVRNGHAPERQLQTGIGPVAVRRPKVRDRGAAADGEPIRFTSAILPPYLRRTRNLEVVCTQMAKTHLLAVGAERDDVADLDDIVADQHSIDQQLDQLPLLGEVGAG